MENKAKKEDETSVNMKVSTDIWKKVGIMSAVQETTKRKIVEAAIDSYYAKIGMGAMKWDQ